MIYLFIYEVDRDITIAFCNHIVIDIVFENKERNDSPLLLDRLEIQIEYIDFVYCLM